MFHVKHSGFLFFIVSRETSRWSSAIIVSRETLQNAPRDHKLFHVKRFELLACFVESFSKSF